MIEEWRPVFRYEGLYEVSNLGRVRSLVRKTKQGRRGGKMLKPTENNITRYLSVSLCRDGNIKRKHVHSMVLEAFRGPRPKGFDTCHDPDPNRSNCRLDNLRWDTRKNNLADMAKQGTPRRGEAASYVKLSEDNVRTIFIMRKDGFLLRQIADAFGVHSSTVSSILCRKNWGHLDLEARP